MPTTLTTANTVSLGRLRWWIRPPVVLLAGVVLAVILRPRRTPWRKRR